MTNLKIHCHIAGALMTDPRNKSEVLSETAKTMLQELFIAERYGREKDFTSAAIQKGLTNEELGITQYCQYAESFLTKNVRRFQNDYLIGTPDIVDTYNDTVIDIKTSWNLFTFIKGDMTKMYEYQLRSYLALTGCKKATLAYVLTDTPDNLIHNEVRRICYQIGSMADEAEIEREVRKQMTFKDIPSHDKIRLFHLEHDPEKIEQLYKRIEAAREYYATLSLSNVKEVVE
jgi:hypothetical protein